MLCYNLSSQIRLITIIIIEYLLCSYSSYNFTLPRFIASNLSLWILALLLSDLIPYINVNIDVIKLTPDALKSHTLWWTRQHIKKQRHYFVNKGPSSQGYGFSSGHVWMWELDYKESWALKNCCFWLWCWRRLLRVPWTARRSNQSILKEISPGCSLEELMLKLKLQNLAIWCEELINLKRPWFWEGWRQEE